MAAIRRFEKLHQTMKGKIEGVGNHANKDLEEKSGVDQLQGGRLMLGDVVLVEMHHGFWWPAQVFDEKAVSGSCKKTNNKLPGEVLVRLYGSYDYMYVDSVRCRSEFENILKQNNGSCREAFQKALEHVLSPVKSCKSEKQNHKETKGEHVKVKPSKAEQPMQEAIRKNQGAERTSHVTLGRHLGKRVRETKAKKTDHVAGKSKDKTSARAAPRGLQVVTSQTKTKCGDFTAEKAEEASKTRTQKDVRKKLKTNSTSPEKNPLDISKESSARRVRVMQNLGLIAPCGSPFFRNGLMSSCG
ncbi:PREDICTED: uncharacterized protein LOC104595480 isoform X2 [Nelumbo nucifera]|uniref:Uncharacterized protein LOC104595480 isoform X2 n=1 Tax=Nelumbo nucifera TaxID=4432 RepID=A0A1U8Q366_NELNU|nr:PREDICTED: uncharacterized protein LOC104595480 isoform X2 [Nelumbo nucifera]